MADESSVFDATLSGFQLGQSDTLLRLSSATEFAQADQVLLAQARRQLFILTYDLEPSRFNDDAFVSAVSAFVRRSRFSDARVLIGDPAIAIRWGHKLVALSRRLPTQLRLRQLNDEDFNNFQRQPELWIVADNRGFLRRDNKEVFRGLLAANAIPAAQRATQQFLEMWERSSVINDFRVLDI
jgi:hypothetical protein